MTGADGTGIRLPHLSGASSAVRLVIAAQAVDGIDHICEIGGAGLPITHFIRHRPKSVTVVDPKIEPYESLQLNGKACIVRHLACKFQQSELQPREGSLAVVMLGVSLKPWGRQPTVTEPLVMLCRSAALVVLEYAENLDRPIQQVPELVQKAELKQLWGVDLVLHDDAITGSGHERRRLSVFRPS